MQASRLKARTVNGGDIVSRSYFLILGRTASLAIASWATLAAQPVTPPPVPGNLQVEAGHKAFLKGSAEGTQNYVCLPSDSGLVGTFQGPQATVFVSFRWIHSDVRQQLMTHFLSPNPDEDGTPARATWQSSIDTSSAWAKKIEESSDSDYVAPGAIPWFLLQVVGASRGPSGGRLLSETTFIQRVNTTGGKLAPTACTLAGSIKFVPYTADYIFYRAVGPK
jgi:hypothetical protein